MVTELSRMQGGEAAAEFVRKVYNREAHLALSNLFPLGFLPVPQDYIMEKLAGRVSEEGKPGENLKQLRAQIKGSGIGTSATRAEILKKLINIKYLALNKKTQIITPTLQGEMVFDVVEHSIRSLLNPELTASWEKGLTYVAEGSISSREYMDKLENFIRTRTDQVMGTNYQYALRRFYDAAAACYPSSKTKKGSK